MSTSPEQPLLPELVAPALTRAIIQLVRRMRADAQPDRLSLAQTSVLHLLEERGALTTADLARAEAMKPQSMGTVLASLEQEGLVSRAPHPTDGRQVLFSLTVAGGEARRQRSAAKQQWLLAAVAQLDPADQQTLLTAAALIKRLGES